MKRLHIAEPAANGEMEGGGALTSLFTRRLPILWTCVDMCGPVGAWSVGGSRAEGEALSGMGTDK